MVSATVSARALDRLKRMLTGAEVTLERSGMLNGGVARIPGPARPTAKARRGHPVPALLLAACDDFDFDRFYHDPEPLITTLHAGQVKLIDRQY